MIKISGKTIMNESVGAFPDMTPEPEPVPDLESEVEA